MEGSSIENKIQEALTKLKVIQKNAKRAKKLQRKYINKISVPLDMAQNLIEEYIEHLNNIQDDMDESSDDGLNSDHEDESEIVIKDQLEIMNRIWTESMNKTGCIKNTNDKYTKIAEEMDMHYKNMCKALTEFQNINPNNKTGNENAVNKEPQEVVKSLHETCDVTSDQPPIEIDPTTTDADPNVYVNTNDNVHTDVKPESRGDPCHLESSKPSRCHQSGIKHSDWHKACSRLLNDLWNDENSKPFRMPSNDPEYLKATPVPMSLNVIQEYHRAYHYVSPQQFKKDLQFIFTNSRNYYTDKESQIYKATEKLEKMFEERIENIIKTWQKTKATKTPSKSDRSSSKRSSHESSGEKKKSKQTENGVIKLF